MVELYQKYPVESIIIILAIFVFFCIFSKKFRRWVLKYNKIIFIALTLFGLHFTYYQIRDNAKNTKFMYLTGVWNDIMKESIKYPEFNDKAKTSTYMNSYQGDNKIEYEIYVRWVGGYIEDLYYNEYKKEGWSFFEPWINDTLEIHRAWFIDHVEYYSKTKSFYNVLQNLKNKGSNPSLRSAESTNDEKS